MKFISVKQYVILIISFIVSLIASIYIYPSTFDEIRITLFLIISTICGESLLTMYIVTLAEYYNRKLD